ENRAGLEGGAETRLAFHQCSLGALSLGDVCNERLDHLASVPFDSRERYFEGDLFAGRGAGHPFELRAAPSEARGDVLACQVRGAFSARLQRRRELARMLAKQLLRARAAQDPDGGWIYLEELFV